MSRNLMPDIPKWGETCKQKKSSKRGQIMDLLKLFATPGDDEEREKPTGNF